MRMIALVAGCASLCACASYPEGIQPNYVSSERYFGLECEELKRLHGAADSEVQAMSANQSMKATHDTMMVGAALLFVPLALIGVGSRGPDQAADIARLKGEREALHRAGQRKECWPYAEPIPADADAAPAPPAQVSRP